MDLQPVVYRAMTDDNGRPLIAPTARGLGARPGDIASDAHGNVHPLTGGMSVTPAWRLPPSHRIPRRLATSTLPARGNDADRIWRFGGAGFQTGQRLNEQLQLRVDPPKGGVVRHGVVEPTESVPAAAYSIALAATQSGWEVDES